MSQRHDDAVLQLAAVAHNYVVKMRDPNRQHMASLDELDSAARACNSVLDAEAEPTPACTGCEFKSNQPVLREDCPVHGKDRPGQGTVEFVRAEPTPAAAGEAPMVFTASAVNYGPDHDKHPRCLACGQVAYVGLTHRCSKAADESPRPLEAPRPVTQALDAVGTPVTYTPLPTAGTFALTYSPEAIAALVRGMGPEERARFAACAPPAYGVATSPPPGEQGGPGLAERLADGDKLIAAVRKARLIWDDCEHVARPNLCADCFAKGDVELLYALPGQRPPLFPSSPRRG